ncbi:hypothetical protein INR49_007464 [Caranx melampygus]|nr:hypothetical protein INR49_007464 [Caranx melampygus]
MMTESFGARVLVGSFSRDGVDYKVSGGDSYLQGCSFHDGFSLGRRRLWDRGLNVDDNVIHHTVGEGIRIWGNNITVRRNLVTMSLWPGSYQDREEPFNFNWNAAIEVNEGTNVVLQHNIVAGYERVGYRIDGEPCPGQWSENERWIHNEAHGGLYGVYMNKDGLPGCSTSRASSPGGTLTTASTSRYHHEHHGFQCDAGRQWDGHHAADLRPPLLSHAYADKPVHVKEADLDLLATIFICTQLSSREASPRHHELQRHQRADDGQRHDLCLLRNVCSSETNFMFMTNPKSEDLQHPVQVSGIQMLDSWSEAQVFIHRPDVSKANPADCVDMDCDAKKKTLLQDQTVPSSVPSDPWFPSLSMSGGRPEEGLGDYRIPKVMLTAPTAAASLWSRSLLTKV